MNDFDGKHVVVTGGTGALGTAVVGLLVERGATCHVPVQEPRFLDDFPHHHHPRVETRAGLDFTVEATVERFYAELPACWASLHIAGGFAMSPFTETSLDDFLSIMNANAVTAFLSCREAVKAIRRSRADEGGRIVNVSARPALNPVGGMVAYGASKAVVNHLTQGLAEELVPEKIWVNAVIPSVMDTPGNRKAMPDADFDSWPKTEEVAETIVFLASSVNRVTRGGLVPVYGQQ
jgi:NAD(P)-dependent dehydrogenase (short-subunit alcohol dehydrogenase family)